MERRDQLLDIMGTMGSIGHAPAQHLILSRSHKEAQISLDNAFLFLESAFLYMSTYRGR
jgi:hypothetical protein